MLDLLQKLFIGHIHNWVIIETSDVNECGRKYGRMFILKCKNCGNLKKKQIDAK